jgi:hypothetical protein
MSRASIEERLAALEKQIAVLLASDRSRSMAKDWRRTRGAFTGDDLMKEVFAAGHKIRDAERRSRRSRASKKRQTRS